jgi:arylsulfatase A-like enzyme
LLPTFLDAAGAKAPKSLDGDSMLKLVRDGSAPWRPYIDLEHSVCYAGSSLWNALTDGHWKYVFNADDGSEQLFDLDKDHGEVTDLAADATHAEMLKLWRSRMVDHLSERGEHYVADGKLMAPRNNLLYSPKFPKA